MITVSLGNEDKFREVVFLASSSDVKSLSHDFFVVVVVRLFSPVITHFRVGGDCVSFKSKMSISLIVKKKSANLTAIRTHAHSCTHRK